MRFGRPAVVLAFAASQASIVLAQPADEQPVEAPADAPKEAPEAPREAAPAAKKPPKPDVAKPHSVEPEVPAVHSGRGAYPNGGPDNLDSQPYDGPRRTPADAGFRFGSYGRVLAGSDLRGGKPQKVAVVAHAPRIVEPSYLELDFSYGFVRPGERNIVVRPVVTLAFDGTLFHDTGDFDAQPALRNMFLDGEINGNLHLWVGSRMYRGDDIYLFDYWPLDDINTVGAGAELKQKLGDNSDVIDLAAHVGFNRLNNLFQFQQIDVPNPVQGATTVDQLNRQRVVASATASYTMMPRGNGPGAKAKLHLEQHSLPSGTRRREDGTREDLPADTGFLIGGELGTFGFTSNDKERNHLNLFMRYAKGLAAFDELAPPTTFGTDLKTQRANELTFGLSGNFDHKFGNLMLGALSRRFTDADADTVDPDDGWEYAVDARPLIHVPRTDFFVGADLSYQARFPKGLNAITLRAEDPAVFQFAPMLVWSPMGPSSYDRPQIRFVYNVAHLNDAARNLYVPDDPRHARSTTYFLGFQAEWWFNSSTYR